LGCYAHLEAFLEHRSKEAKGRSPHLFTVFREQVAEAVQEIQSKLPIILRASQTSPVQSDQIISFLDYLVDQSDRFQRVHNALRSFATSWPDSEVFEFLKRLFGEDELRAEFDALNPTIVYWDEFNFLRYDLRQDLLLRRTAPPHAVWALPKAESTNPLLWPVLVHEVAHSLYQPEVIQLAAKKSANLKLTQQQLTTLLHWSVELNADYFAYRILGPAYIMCLMYFGMFFGGGLREPVGADGRFVAHTHPPPNVRIDFLRREFSKFCETNGLGKNSAFVQYYDLFCGLYEARLNLDQERRDSECDAALSDPGFEDALAALWDAIRRAQSTSGGLRTECFCQQEMETAYRLSDHLLRGWIAPTTRADLQLGQLGEYLRDPVGTGLSKRAVLERLDERPATMFEVITAGWLARIRWLYRLSAETLVPSKDALQTAPSAFEKASQTFSRNSLRDSRELSVLLQKSIQISRITSAISNTPPHSCRPHS
jgi:hypothetical protein